MDTRTPPPPQERPRSDTPDAGNSLPVNSWCLSLLSVLVLVTVFLVSELHGCWACSCSHFRRNWWGNLHRPSTKTIMRLRQLRVGCWGGVRVLVAVLGVCRKAEAFGASFRAQTLGVSAPYPLPLPAPPKRAW